MNTHTHIYILVSEITNSAYWRNPFNSLATAKNLVEYYVLDVEPLGQTRGKVEFYIFIINKCE